MQALPELPHFTAGDALDALTDTLIYCRTVSRTGQSMAHGARMPSAFRAQVHAGPGCRQHSVPRGMLAEFPGHTLS